jgi:2-polyprenyl-6-methoxyphenol hydroxylase-like FAD-dependent oxidoreductase
MAPPHVIIIGAGIAGLSLGQGLKKAGVALSIFERDVNAFARPQGYRLRINSVGTCALRDTLLSPSMWSLFQDTAAKTDLGFSYLDPLSGSLTSRFVGHNPNLPGPAPDPAETFTCDRTTLRATLMYGLEDSITYGKEFSHYVVLHDGTVDVKFTDGFSVKGSLLVGADGVHSRVRRQYIPNHTLLDTEGRIIFGKTPLTPELISRFPQQGLEFITTAIDPRPVTLFLEPVRFDRKATTPASIPVIPDYVHWVLAANRSSFGQDDAHLFSLAQKELPPLVDSLTKEWSPSIKSLFDLQSPDKVSIMRVTSAQPTMKPWTTTGNVTLLGDAVHVMSPTGGQGANAALRDAASLCQAIEKGASVEALAAFEQDMRERAIQEIKVSIGPGKKMFNQRSFEECKPINYDCN